MLSVIIKAKKQRKKHTIHNILKYANQKWEVYLILHWFKPAAVTLTLSTRFRWREARGYYDRLLPIYHPHDTGNIDEWLINLNTGESDEGCLKFCNILKLSATVQRKLLKGCQRVQCIMTAYVWMFNDRVNINMHLDRRSLKFWIPSLQLPKPIGKSDIAYTALQFMFIFFFNWSNCKHSN